VHDEITHENEGEADREGDDEGDREGDDYGGREGEFSAEENEDDEAFLGSEYNEDDYSSDGKEISYTDNEGLEGNYNGVNDSIFSDLSQDEPFVIYGVDDIVKMDMFNLQNEDVSKLQFGSFDEIFINFVGSYSLTLYARYLSLIQRKGLRIP